MLAAAGDYVRACHFPHAREIYERLADDGDPSTRLTAAMGFEDASWRPGLVGARAVHVVTLVRPVRSSGGGRDPRARDDGEVGVAVVPRDGDVLRDPRRVAVSGVPGLHDGPLKRKAHPSQRVMLQLQLL